MFGIKLLSFELAIHWLSVILYVVSFVFFVCGFIFQQERGFRGGTYLAWTGLLVHSLALILRWLAAGHGPYLAKYEGYSSFAWVVVLMFLLIIIKKKELTGLGMFILAPCFFLMAIGLMADQAIQQVPSTFRSIWLVIHIGFTKLALGSLLISLGCAVLYLFKKKNLTKPFYEKIPSLKLLDIYSYQFAGFGFVFWTITIAAGALWANQSWGRYWGWDPIETWSLITWLLLGFYFHMRRFFYWRGRRAAYLIILCFALSLMTIFFIPLVLNTIHVEFFL